MCCALDNDGARAPDLPVRLGNNPDRARTGGGTKLGSAFGELGTMHARPRDCIDRIRCPDIKDLPTVTIRTLHRSMVKITRLRRSVE